MRNLVDQDVLFLFAGNCGNVGLLKPRARCAFLFFKTAGKGAVIVDGSVYFLVYDGHQLRSLGVDFVFYNVFGR